MPKAPSGTALNRRTLMKAGAASAVGMLLAPNTGLSQPGRPGGIRLGDQTEVIIGLGGNVVLHTENGGAILIDSGAGSQTGMLLQILDERVDNANPLVLFNTHWHLDQVGGNAALGERGAEIIAHAKTAAHLSVPHFQPVEDSYRQPLPPAAQPTSTFLAEGRLDFGRERLSYGYLLEAHTDGDIYVHFENLNVIATGDAISPMLDPVLDWYGGGWLGGRIDSLELLLELGDSETRYVPSYGRVVDRAYVQSELELMQQLYEILWQRVRAGETAEDIRLSGALDTLPRQFDDPARLLYDFHKSMWAHYNTLSPDIV